MPINTSHQRVAIAVNQIIDRLCQQHIEASIGQPGLLPLWRAIQQVISGSGKCLRPYLIVLAHDTCKGSNESLMEVAAAWELLHQSLLIHDDIIDRDYVRHGQLNVAGLFKKRYRRPMSDQPTNHYANSAALLAGDLVLSTAFQLLAGTNLKPAKKQAITSLFSETLAVTLGGELLDTEAGLRALNKRQALQIATTKTTAYSFSGPLQAGALLANAPANIVASFGELGQILGLAYQLQDDLLGLFGQTATTGKSNKSDLREGKRTLLFEYSYQAATPIQKSHMANVMGNPQATGKDIERFRQIVVSSGAKQKVEDDIAQKTAESQAILNRLGLASKDWTQLFRYLLQRDH